MRIWGYEDMRIWGYEVMRIWGYEDMRIWGYEDMVNHLENQFCFQITSPRTAWPQLILVLIALGVPGRIIPTTARCVLFSIWIWGKGENIPTTTNLFICSFSYLTLSVIFGQFQPLNNRYFCRLWSIFSITHVNRLVLVELEAYFPVFRLNWRNIFVLFHCQRVKQA